MAKKSGSEGKGDTKNVSAEQHKANRQAAKARKHRGRATGLAARNSGGDLFARIADDQRREFLENGRDTRNLHGSRALLTIMSIRDSLAVHSPTSSTFIKGQLAADVATQLIRTYQETDPQFAYPKGLRLQARSLDLACNAVRANMAHIERQVLEAGIREGREAIATAMNNGRQRVLAPA